jgi:hypothetical protein
MKIQLEKIEKEEYFFNALCNGLGYVESGYGLELIYDEKDYKKAQSALSAPCYEDVLMEILRTGGQLIMRDHGGGDDDVYITLQQVYDNMDKVDPKWILQMHNEEDDAVTADVIIQTVFLGEVIYG